MWKKISALLLYLSLVPYSAYSSDTNTDFRELPKNKAPMMHPSIPIINVQAPNQLPAPLVTNPTSNDISSPPSNDEDFLRPPPADMDPQIPGELPTNPTVFLVPPTESEQTQNTSVSNSQGSPTQTFPNDSSPNPISTPANSAPDNSGQSNAVNPQNTSSSNPNGTPPVTNTHNQNNSNNSVARIPPVTPVQLAPTANVPSNPATSPEQSHAVIPQNPAPVPHNTAPGAPTPATSPPIALTPLKQNNESTVLTPPQNTITPTSPTVIPVSPESTLPPAPNVATPNQNITTPNQSTALAPSPAVSKKATPLSKTLPVKTSTDKIEEKKTVSKNREESTNPIINPSNTAVQKPIKPKTNSITATKPVNTTKKKEIVVQEQPIPATIYRNNYGPENSHLPPAYDTEDYEILIFKTAAWGQTAILNSLLDEIKNIELKDSQGNTPLMFAVKNKHIDCVRLLLAKGANPCASNNRNISSLDIAERYGTEEILKLLESYSENYQC